MEKIQKSVTMQTIKIYAKHSRDHLGKVITIALCTLFTIIAGAYVPWAYKHLIDTMTEKGVSGQVEAMWSVALIAGTHNST